MLLTPPQLPIFLHSQLTPTARPLQLPRLATIAPKPWQIEEDDVALLDAPDEPRQLVVYNDEVNTFDHVIRTLIDICGHSAEQAEQCTLLIHYKGKCSVKLGSYTELEPRCSAIHKRGISADIE